jgi:8-oxo-dGTP pyrophosphatase MutT (NUDIX family)
MNIKEDLRRELEEEYGIDPNHISTSDDVESLLEGDDYYTGGSNKKKKNK